MQEGVQGRRWSPASSTGSHGTQQAQERHPAAQVRQLPRQSSGGDTLSPGSWAAQRASTGQQQWAHLGEELLHSLREQKQTVRALWVDFSKAFGIVSHIILLETAGCSWLGQVHCSLGRTLAGWLSPERGGEWSYIQLGPLPVMSPSTQCWGQPCLISLLAIWMKGFSGFIFEELYTNFRQNQRTRSWSSYL